MESMSLQNNKHVLNKVNEQMDIKNIKYYMYCSMIHEITELSMLKHLLKQPWQKITTVSFFYDIKCKGAKFSVSEEENRI